MKRKYPKEIYGDGRELFIGPGRNDLADLVEEAYDTGFSDGRADSASTDGFFSLSRAYGEGARIDWEQLDGRLARIVFAGYDGAIGRRLQRNTCRSIDHISGWVPSGATLSGLFSDALRLQYDMELFVEGEIPLRRLTADELPVGTLFIGDYLGSHGAWVRYDRELPNGEMKGCASKIGSLLDVNKPELITVEEVLGDGVVPEGC